MIEREWRAALINRPQRLYVQQAPVRGVHAEAEETIAEYLARQGNGDEPTD